MFFMPLEVILYCIVGSFVEPGTEFDIDIGLS